MGGKPKPVQDRYKMIVVVKHGVVVDVYATAYFKYAVMDLDVMIPKKEIESDTDLQFEITERYQSFFKDLLELQHPID